MAALGFFFEAEVASPLLVLVAGAAAGVVGFAAAFDCFDEAGLGAPCWLLALLAAGFTAAGFAAAVFATGFVAAFPVFALGLAVALFALAGLLALFACAGVVFASAVFGAGAAGFVLTT